MRVGVVGVGRMGAPMVARLVGAGHEVVATDIRSERREAVDGAGARWAADPSEAVAGSDVVLTVLPGNPELQEFVLDSDQLLSAVHDEAVWVDLTSASFELGQECARRARTRDVAYLDAPCGGGVPAMRDGTVTLYVGGEVDVLERTVPVLRSFAGTIHHLGDHGTGYLTKLLVNLLWFGQAALTTEALLLAQRHGGSPQRMRDVLLGSAGDSAFVTRHLPALLEGDYLSDFSLDRCVEELAAIEHSADRAGTPHSLTSAVTDLHRAALHHFGAVDGELMASAWLEEQAGSRLRGDEDQS